MAWRSARHAAVLTRQCCHSSDLFRRLQSFHSSNGHSSGSKGSATGGVVPHLRRPFVHCRVLDSTVTTLTLRRPDGNGTADKGCGPAKYGIQVEQVPLLALMRRDADGGAASSSTTFQQQQQQQQPQRHREQQQQGYRGPAPSRVDTRDLMTLGVTREGEIEQMDANDAPTCILPRQDCYLLSMGIVRAIVYEDVVYILGGENAEVNREASQIAEVMWTTGSNDAYLGDNDPFQQYFELHFLDATLQVVCSSITNHVDMLGKLTEAFVHSVEASTPTDIPDSLVHYQPLLDELGSQEARIGHMSRCFSELMADHGNMAAMLLTAQTAGRRLDKDSEDYDELEVILEAHHRTLRHAAMQVDRLTKNVRFGWALGDMKLSAYRTQLDRVHVNIGIAAVSLAGAAVVTGSFGMNVPIPLDEVAWSFTGIVLACTLGMGAFWVGVRKYLQIGSAHVERLRVEKAVASRKVMGDIEKVGQILHEANQISSQALQRHLEDGLGRSLTASELQRVGEILPLFGVPPLETNNQTLAERGQAATRLLLAQASRSLR